MPATHVISEGELIDYNPPGPGTLGHTSVSLRNEIMWLTISRVFVVLNQGSEILSHWLIWII